MAIVEAIAAAVACDLVTLNEIDPHASRFLVVRAPSDHERGAVAPSLHRQFMLSHPLYRHAIESGDPGPARLSDQPDATLFQAGPLYRSVVGPRTTFEAAVLLPAPPNLLTCIVLDRHSCEFNDADLDALESLRVPLSRIYRRSVASDLLRRRLASTPAPLTAVRESDGLSGVGPSATDALERWLTPCSDDADLAAWMDRCEHAEPGIRRAEPFTIVSAQGVLRLRYLGQDPDGLSRFEIDERLVPPGALVPLGLSNRECEVLSLLVQGAPTKTIASRLQCRPATVKKHLEHIYERLGVHDRQSAVTFVFEALEGDPGP